MIIYELLVGEVPTGSFDPPSRRKPELDRRLDGIVSKCLKPIPSDRYSKVSELIGDLEPLVPLSFSQLPKKVSGLQRLQHTARQAVRRATKIAAGLVVGAAVVVLGVTYLTSGQDNRAVTVGRLLADPSLPSKGTALITGRLEGSSDRKLTFGEGTETFSLLTYGRQATAAKGGVVTFASPDMDERVGRALPDLDFNAESARWSALATTPADSSFFRPVRALTGKPLKPRSALMLLGTSGRYAAVVAPSKGMPPSFEYALGELSSQSSATWNVPDGSTRLELAITPDGELSAYVWHDKEGRKRVGAPVPLGAGWKRAFGGMPKPAFGCADGVCEFKEISFTVENDTLSGRAHVPESRPSVTAAKTVAPVKRAPAPVKKAPPPKKSTRRR